MDNRPIGVFDSGVGGMTVLKEIMKKLPTESFIYLGDTKRFPYGSKTKESIIELTKNGIEFLINKGVKLIVIACGTATSQALDTVKDLYNIPIIGVISPTVEYINKTNKKNIGVIATAGTIRSKGWEKAILEKISDAKVQSIACPLLAPMVEEGWNENKIATLAVKEYLKPFNKIQALILGCTHYPLLTKVIKKQIGKKVEIINIGNFVAIKTEQILNELRINSIDNKNQLEVYLTETECKFNEVASKLIGKDIQAKQVKEEIVIK
ncbi:MAG: glutamate racemase [Clostridia bacterium]